MNKIDWNYVYFNHNSSKSTPQTGMKIFQYRNSLTFMRHLGIKQVAERRNLPLT